MSHLAKAKGEAPVHNFIITSNYKVVTIERKSTWSWACYKNHLSAETDLKKTHNLDESKPETAIRHAMLVSGCTVLIAVNWPRHGCARLVCRLPHQLEFVRIYIAFPVVRTDEWTNGRSVTCLLNSRMDW